MEWGNIAEGVGGVGSLAAAAVAVGTATSDRWERRTERRADEKTRARLVQLSVKTESNRPAVAIEVRNFGPLPVVDVRLVDATWSEHPGARWMTMDTHWQARGLARNSVHRPILMPSQGVKDTFDTVVEFVICFLASDRGSDTGSSDRATHRRLSTPELHLD